MNPAYLLRMGSIPTQRLADRRRQERRIRRRRPLAAFAALVAIVAVGLAAAIFWWSGATLAGDPVALARVEVQPLGGSLVSARAFGPGGARIPLSVDGGRLLPRTLLVPGEAVSVVVVVRRPAWLGWALGRNRTERLTLHAPLARLTQRWLTIAPHAALRLRFADPVARVSYRAEGRRRVISPGGRRVVSLGAQAPSGAVEVASAARAWERLSAPVRVTWFPASRLPVVLVSPALDHPLSPRAPIRLTFSRTLADAIGDARPQFSAHVPGSWRSTDSHTLVFTPTGFGFPFAATPRLEFPRELSVSIGNAPAKPVRSVGVTIAGASLLRLQQLLAGAGYLPVDWQPAGQAVAQQPLAEIDAAVNPPEGTFTWRFPSTPSELQRLWTPAQPNQITRGAVMMFEHDHDLAVDGFAGAQVWRALLTDAVAGTKRTDGYSYVYVHRDLPQLLTLWHNGRTVLTSPGNTGVPAAPTQLGTYPVFEHIPVGTMSGTNPDGSHYNDPGIQWISYFHGGDALHSFNRASFGTPQSLGCVELPLATAAQVWPYTPIGTLVTIEN
jgi:peptidoglycan hydrolase-like protein with peptidoglycan-binding domain